ncbi:MAG TPA: alginate lyase family protein, partial [Verrucomicrobiae bacterium]
MSCLLAAASGGSALGQAFVHPGCLETEADFARMNTKIALGQSPWIDSYNILIANSHAQNTYTPSPVAVLVRGTGNSACSTENYSHAYNDAAAAYQLALRWKITGDTSFANASINVLNAWSSTCTNLCGDSNGDLAAGLYGYQFACAAEIMRTYSGWSSSDFTRFKNFMVNVFYPWNHAFLTGHNGTCISHYWANW